MQTQTTVVILTRDRTDLLRQTLTSVLAQDVPVWVQISDNSVGAETQDMLRLEFPQIQCVRRQPPLPALEHFSTVLSEACTEFLVMFHDDDVMLPGYVRTLQSTLTASPGLVAVGCNAGKLHQEDLMLGTVMGSFPAALTIDRPQELLPYYFRKGAIGPAPFPSYMYRTAATRGLGLVRAHGGKYSDVSFLLKLLERGSVVWMPQVLMHYRYHGANDSGTPTMNDMASLVRFVGQRYGLNRRAALVKEFRLRNWLQWLLFLRRHPELAEHHPRRRFLVTCAVVRGMLGFVWQRPQWLWLGLQRLLGSVRQRLLP
jgi:hypothetical protein